MRCFSMYMRMEEDSLFAWANGERADWTLRTDGDMADGVYLSRGGHEWTWEAVLNEEEGSLLHMFDDIASLCSDAYR